MQHIVVRRGALFSRDVAIPVDWVRSITPDMVVLEATRESVARLPVYRPDDELKEDVEDVLSREEHVRALDLPVRVDVEDGVVRLRDFVYNHAVRSRLEELARSIPGVVDVRNDLAVDMDLLQRVVAALQSDPRTRSLRGYRIEVREGVVELEGSVASIDAATALEEVVASVSDIRGIANHLVGPEIPDHWRRVVQPEIGQPVLASDRELGRVQYVVVHPRTRREEGIVVNAVSPEPGSLPFAETPVWSRLLVIPVSEVERITPAGVFLRVHGGGRPSTRNSQRRRIGIRLRSGCLLSLITRVKFDSCLWTMLDVSGDRGLGATYVLERPSRGQFDQDARVGGEIPHRGAPHGPQG